MTPRERLQRLLIEHRTDPIYNVCLRCGQTGHCSAACPGGGNNAAVQPRAEGTSRCNSLLGGNAKEKT